ncbi:ABC transporter family substrate-binding protein [Amycolatopsis keratiniphila]|uniref:ABC transporter family substrate-binding protein n=1 Tax=Amycolatopsis keratiniphila TaxID=129921 RepID=UPI0033DEFDF3
MRVSRLTVFFVLLIFTLPLAMSACRSDRDGGNNSTNNAAADIKGMATGRAQDGENFKLGESDAFDQVTVAIDQGYSSYNNKTPDAISSYNTFVLAPVLSGTHIVDGNNKVLLNKDVMESVRVTSKDPQVVEYKIRPDVKWSDGESWDCDDFYLGWLANSGKVKAFKSATTTGYDLMSDASCKDDLTFATKYEAPYLDYQGMFTGQVLMPAHILERSTGISDITMLKPDGDAGALTRAGEFWSNAWRGFSSDLMPGSGPYKITRFDPNSTYVTLERNPYWIGAKGGPNKISVRAMPDTRAMATALSNGEVDVVGSVQPDVTAASTLQGLAAQGVTYGSAPRLAFEHFDLNFNRLFADESARKAFFQVVDRREIVDKLIRPVQADAAPLNSIVYLPGESGYVDRYSDKAGSGADAAVKTLEQGGWVKGTDGVYAKEGKRFSVRISHDGNTRRTQTVEIVQSQAARAGIEIKNDTDPNFSKGRADKGDYDIALFGWSSEPFKAVQRSMYSSDGRQNWQGLNDPKIDTAFDIAVSATDKDVATKAYQAADKAISENYATLPVFQTPSMWAFRGIDRVYLQPYYGPMWNVGEWARTG